MFTGLVQAVGVLCEVAPSPAGLRLTVDFGEWTHVPAPGDSISVSGCCLTVAAVDGRAVSFDVIPQTLARTSLGTLTVGSRVNLEHSVTPTTLMGGHLVQGHVDGVGAVERVETAGEWRVRIRPPRALLQYLAPQGSVCVEGVSLTIAGLDPSDGWFEVALIPTTLELTTLGSLRRGHPVNLEMDIIGKTVIGWLEAREAASAPVRRPAPIRRSKP